MMINKKTGDEMNLRIFGNAKIYARNLLKDKILNKKHFTIFIYITEMLFVSESLIVEITGQRRIMKHLLLACIFPALACTSKLDKFMILINQKEIFGCDLYDKNFNGV